jgi:hypothetical protein
MLKAQVLLSMTPNKVRRRTKDPKIYKYFDRIQDFQGKSYRTIYLHTSLHNEDSSGSNYNLAIRNKGTAAEPSNYLLRPDSQLWVHCSCPYFTFYLEVALTLQKTSNVYDSNGALPKKLNTGLKPFLCKHLYAALTSLMLTEKTKTKYVPK